MRYMQNMAAELPGVERYVINIIDREKSSDSPIDGFSEFWFEDLASMRLRLSCSPGQGSREELYRSGLCRRGGERPMKG